MSYNSEQKYHTLAVYGTLKSGHGNNYLLKDSWFIGSGKTKENYAITGLKYVPMVFKKPAIAPIVVEVYEVKWTTLFGPIDRLEGNGSFYNREKIKITMDDDNEIEAWMYLGMINYNQSWPNPNYNGMYNWGI